MERIGPSRPFFLQAYRFSGWTPPQYYVPVMTLNRFTDTGLFMRGGILIFLAGVGAVIGVASTPPHVRQDLAEHTGIPDHYVMEAERQLNVFVTWARNEVIEPVADPDVAEDRAELPL
jgi:hypothetical protein